MSVYRPGLLAIAGLATCLAGCPRGSGGKTPVIPAGEHDDALTIPPTPATFTALDELESRGRQGDLASAWNRARYLLDLFDDARFGNDARSRAALWKVLGPLGADDADRGPAATARAIEALEIEVDRVLEIDRLHAGASAAKTLLAYDASPPTRRDQVLQRMIELKGAGNVTDVEANATLRLTAYCARALEDATRAAWAERPLVLSHCLYPLYSSDPDAYFDRDPERRPPLPRWQDLVEVVRTQLSTIVAPSRLAHTAAQVSERIATATAARKSELPQSLDPAGLPRADHATPYDWTPIMDEPTAGADLREVAGGIALPLEGDGRGVVALRLPATTPRDRFDLAVRSARAAGAEAIELLYDTVQVLSVPAGDYWHGRLADNTVHRAAVVRVNLGTDERSDGTPQAGPNEPRWDPARARLGLHLIVDSTHWRLLAPEGELASIAHGTVKGDPETELRVALSRVRAAFPGEAGLLVVLAPNGRYADFARAIQAAARDDQGRTLFPMLALAESAPRATGSTLPRRVERRWAARVEVTPASLEPGVAGARACYQDRLETDPAYASTMNVQRVGNAARIVSGGGGKALDRCIEAALTNAMVSGKVDSATLTLAPR